MSHLTDSNIGYFKHLLKAWRRAFMLFVHGIFPNVWKTKVIDEIIKNRVKNNVSR